MNAGKSHLRYLSIFLCISMLTGVFEPEFVNAQCRTKKDTCSVSIYIKNIYDLQPGEYAYSADFWLWCNYKNKAFDPLENIEVINAKQATYTDQYHAEANKATFLANESGRITAIHHWQSENYPFDTQHLHVILEAGLDTSEMIMLPLGNDFKLYKGLSLPGWEIAGHSYETELANYDSDFGETCLKGKSSFSRIIYEVVIRRKGWGLFCKLLFGAYISFFVAFLSFFLPPSRDQRFGLSIGGLFAAIANKYVVDSDIPSSMSFSFIDQVHVLTFGFVLLTLVLSVIALKKEKGNQHWRIRFDRKSAITVASLYILINIVLIIVAYHV